MPRQHVFLVHGMGEHRKGEWHKPFVKVIVDTLTRYGAYKGMSQADIEADHLHFLPVTYDDVLSDYRERWQHLGGEMAERVSEESQEMGDALRALSDSAATRSGLEGFFWTHLLDPLLWHALPVARMRVVAEVTDQIGKGLMAMNGAERTSAAHIVAHSLGTSVTHDSLVALRWWSGHGGLFDPERHVWQTVAMVANVSRLFEATFKLDNEHDLEEFRVYESVLNPRVDGSICRKYFNVHHEVDPFTWPRRFRPDDCLGGGGEDVEVFRVRKPSQVHDFDHYFEDPNVHLSILSHLTRKAGSLCTQPEVDAAKEKFENDFPLDSSAKFDNLRVLLGADPNSELSFTDLAKYMYAAMKELMT